MNRPRRHLARVVAVATAGAIVAAACSSGESATDAGRDDDSGSSTEAPETAGTAGEAPDETTPAGSLEDHPECPVDALDDADGPVEVTFWHSMGSDNEVALEALASEYNQSQDQVTVRLENQIGYNEMVETYRLAGQGARPEMLMMPEYMLQEMADSESAIPIGACIEASGFDTGPFIERTFDAYATEGIQWAMPFNTSNPVLIYRRDMFEEAGLDPDVPPRTLDELRDYSQQLMDAGAAGGGIALESGADSGGGWFMEQWLAKAGELFADNDNGRSAPATEVLFASDAGVELFTEVQALVDDGLAIYVGDNSTTGFDQLLQLADESNPAAMAIASSATLGSILTILGGGQIPGVGPDDFGVGPMPGPDTYTGTLVGGAALYVMSEKSDAATAGAWDFIQYATTAQAQSEWAAATGYVPVRDDALDIDPLQTLYEEDPRFTVAYEQLTVASDDPSSDGPVLGPMREIRAANADATAAILSGGDVQAELERAASRANSLLQDYNES